MSASLHGSGERTSEKPVRTPHSGSGWHRGWSWVCGSPCPPCWWGWSLSGHWPPLGTPGSPPGVRPCWVGQNPHQDPPALGHCSGARADMEMLPGGLGHSRVGKTHHDRAVPKPGCDRNSWRIETERPALLKKLSLISRPTPLRDCKFWATEHGPAEGESLLGLPKNCLKGAGFGILIEELWD